MSKIVVKVYVLGHVQTNCYLVFNQETKEAVIIDPADQAAYLIRQCHELDLQLKAILLTHGHYDHVMAVNELAESLRIPVYANRLEEHLLNDPSMNLSSSNADRPITIKADHLLTDGDELDLIGFHWKVVSTPGHTAGSTCYWIETEQLLFSGDTLFRESLGRTDMPTGNTATIIKSIVEKLFTLPAETVVLPGHSEATTIEHEKRFNPVAQYIKG